MKYQKSTLITHNKTSKYIQIITLLIVIILICVFILPTYFIFPSADDYSFANKLENGFFQSQLNWYNGWTGRFASTFLNSLMGYSLSCRPVYNFIPIVLILLLILSFYHVLRNTTVISKLTCIYSSGLLAVFYLALLPSISQGLYWASGSLTYQTSVILYLSTCVFFIKMYKSEKYSLLNFSKIDYIKLLLFSIMCIGCNETIIPPMIGLYLLYFIFVLTDKNKISKRIIIIFFVAILFSFIVILAPGNKIRTSIFIDADLQVSNVLFSTFYSLKRSYIDLIKFLTQPVYLFLCILIFTLTFKKMRFNNKTLYIQYVLIIFYSLFCIFCVNFMSFYSMGCPPPLRTTNLMLLFLIILTTSFALLLNKILQLQYKTDYWMSILVLFSAFYLFTTKSNFRAILSDYRSKRYVIYKNENQQRINIVNKSFESKHVVIDSISVYPKSIFFDDITTNANDWKNNAFADYFGLKSISIKK